MRDLASSTTSHTFPTVDLVAGMEHSPVGNYLATLETRGEATYVRVYLNWWSSEAAGQPMRARVPGLTPSHQVDRQTVRRVCDTAGLNVSTLGGVEPGDGGAGGEGPRDRARRLPRYRSA